MSESDVGHEEHLDAWGKMRRDAIQDWHHGASRAMWEGKRFKSAVYGIAEAAAEHAPHSVGGLLFEVGTMAAGAGITKAAKVMRVGELFESAREARLAGKILNLGRTIYRDRGQISLAESLGRRYGTRVALSAGHAATEVAHASSSLQHSATQIKKYAPALVGELKRNGAAAKPGVIRLQPKPVVEQGTRSKSGAILFPKSRQLILPAVTITGVRPGHRHNHTRGSLQNRTFTTSSIPRFELRRPSLTRHVVHQRPTLGVPRLRLNPGLRPQQPSVAHRITTLGSMKLTRPQLRVAPPRHHFHAPTSHFRR